MSFSLLSAVVLSLACGAALAHESPIDHVNRTIRMDVKDDQLLIDYRLQMTPRTVLLQMRAMDGDSNGRISDKERRTYFDSSARELSRALALSREDESIRIKTSGSCVLRPDLSNEYHFAAELGELTVGRHEFAFRDSFARKYPGSIRVRTPIPEAGQDIELTVRESPRGKAGRGHPAEVELIIEITVAEK